MERRVVNPWTWQDEFGFVQANEVTGAERVLLCSGQTSVNENGEPVNPADMVAQVHQALDNLETVLRQAGFELGDLVRLNIYTTDMDRFLESYGEFGGRVSSTRVATTLLGVTRLAFPELLVELEATAVK
jgi:enamine deaminase RidA (YjgF/YER057c/UK114 family)